MATDFHRMLTFVLEAVYDFMPQSRAFSYLGSLGFKGIVSFAQSLLSATRT